MSKRASDSEPEPCKRVGDVETHIMSALTEAQRRPRSTLLRSGQSYKNFFAEKSKIDSRLAQLPLDMFKYYFDKGYLDGDQPFQTPYAESAPCQAMTDFLAVCCQPKWIGNHRDSVFYIATAPFQTSLGTTTGFSEIWVVEYRPRAAHAENAIFYRSIARDLIDPENPAALLFNQHETPYIVNPGGDVPLIAFRISESKITAVLAIDAAWMAKDDVSVEIFDDTEPLSGWEFCHNSLYFDFNIFRQKKLAEGHPDILLLRRGTFKKVLLPLKDQSMLVSSEMISVPETDPPISLLNLDDDSLFALDALIAADAEDPLDKWIEKAKLSRASFSRLCHPTKLSPARTVGVAVVHSDQCAHDILVIWCMKTGKAVHFLQLVNQNINHCELAFLDEDCLSLIRMTYNDILAMGVFLK